MKKFKFVLLVVAIVALLCGCSAENKTCKKINELFDEATEYTVTVKTTTDGVELIGVYVFECFENGYTVSYDAERLNKINADDLSDGFKRSVVGTVTVLNDLVVSNTGDLVDLPKRLNFNFSGKCLSEITDADGRMTAKVTDVEAFTGGTKTADVRDMSVSTEYTDEKLVKTVLNYSTDSSLVVVEVIFN